MRPLLLLILFVCSTSALAAERTWTIARDVFEAEGELVAVRGERVYLRIDGKVEEVAIDRLSALDQQYLATISLTPAAPGPNPVFAEGEERSLLIQPGPALYGNEAPRTEAVQKAVANEEMPLPGPSDQGHYAESNDLQLNAPALVPATGGQPIRAQTQTRAQAQQPWIPNRVDRNGRALPPQPGVQAGYFTPDEGPQNGANANANDRRYRRPPQQAQQRQQPQQPNQNGQQPRANRDDDNDDDNDRGFFGFRARRLQRERAAAGRDR
jgi:hypothetical protein